MTTAELAQGRIAEATVMADGTWIAWDRDGKRLVLVDVEDHEFFDWLIRERPWENEPEPSR